MNGCARGAAGKQENAEYKISGLFVFLFIFLKKEAFIRGTKSEELNCEVKRALLVLKDQRSKDIK